MEARDPILFAREAKARREVIQAIHLIDVTRRAPAGSPEVLIVNAQIALARLEHLIERRTGRPLDEDDDRDPDPSDSP